MTRILGLKIGTDAASYTQTRVTFDGSDYISYTDNSNIAASTGLTFSCWFDLSGNDTVANYFFNHVTRIWIYRNASSKLQWDFKNTSNVTIWAGSSNDSLLAADGLTHVAMAFDGSGGTGQVYINGVSAGVTNTTVPTAGTLDWDRNTSSFLFASTAGAGFFVGTVGDFWLSNAYHDLSTNIGNFISGGNPVDLSGFGTPRIWLGGTMVAADWNAIPVTNLGSYTASLTMNGAVT